MSEKIILEDFHECDGKYLGAIIGFYYEGHCNRFAFFYQAVAAWMELEQERFEDGDFEPDDNTEYSFKSSKVKQVWYRLPTDKELESGTYKNDNKFIFYDKEAEGLEPITYIEFE